MEEPLEKIEKGWPAIKQAPFHFAGAVIALVALGWFGIYLLYAAIIQGKDATIQAKEATIDAMQRSVEAIQQTVVAKDDLIHSITNQQYKLFIFQGELATAQANLLQQQKQLDDVEYWIKNIYSQTTLDQISASDTNRIVVFPERGFAVAKLKSVPVQNSVHGVVVAIGKGQEPLLPILHHHSNTVGFFFGGEWDNIWKDKLLVFQYVNNARNTNLINNIQYGGSNLLTADGIPTELNSWFNLTK